MSTIVVVGGGFAGMSVAARLSKLRHTVILIEAGTDLGGRLLPMNEGPWYLHPPTVTLPAVLRDLFRKSGRPLERALSMDAEPGRRHMWPDGTALDLALGNRGNQYASLRDAFDEDHAEDWSTWVDQWTDAWDALRRVALDRLLDSHHDFSPKQWRRLHPRRSLRQVAKRGPVDRRLASIITADARLEGYDIRRLPAIWAVQQFVERNFGRWSFTGGTEALAAALATRLRERKVDVRLNTRALAVRAGPVVDTDGVDGSRAIGADDVVWCAGPPPCQRQERLPLVPSTRTLIRLDEPVEIAGSTGLPSRDITVHTDPPLRLWSVDRAHWTIAHQNAVDPLAATASAGLDLRPCLNSRHDIPPGELITRAHFGWQIDSTRQALSPRHRDASTGAWQAGTHGSLAPSMEMIGMTTAAVADAIGPVPRT